MRDVHLASGDTVRILAADVPKGDPTLVLWNGDRVFLAGGRGVLRARTRDDALTEGINTLIFRPGRVTKADLWALLNAADQAEQELDLV